MPRENPVEGFTIPTYGCAPCGKSSSWEALLASVHGCLLPRIWMCQPPDVPTPDPILYDAQLTVFVTNQQSIGVCSPSGKTAVGCSASVRSYSPASKSRPQQQTIPMLFSHTSWPLDSTQMRPQSLVSLVANFALLPTVHAWLPIPCSFVCSQCPFAIFLLSCLSIQPFRLHKLVHFHKLLPISQSFSPILIRSLLRHQFAWNSVQNQALKSSTTFKLKGPETISNWSWYLSKRPNSTTNFYRNIANFSSNFNKLPSTRIRRVWRLDSKLKLPKIEALLLS